MKLEKDVTCRRKVHCPTKMSVQKLAMHRPQFGDQGWVSTHSKGGPLDHMVQGDPRGRIRTGEGLAKQEELDQRQERGGGKQR